MPEKAQISEQDLAQIEKLRQAVRDELTPYYDTDFNLLRWLKGHHYSMEEIVPKLRNHLRFRRSHWDLDGMAAKPRAHPIHAHWRFGLTGRAERVPDVFVNIEQSGTNDYWGMLQTHALSEIMKARVYDLEVMLRTVMDEEAKTGRQTAIMYVMDLTGLHYDRHLLTLLTGALSSISAFMAEHYVEMIHSFVLVNAPASITTLWRIARPLLPERTRNKVKILGPHWKSEILELGVPSVFPDFWNSPGEETFTAKVDKAVPFPPEGYYQEKSIPDGKHLTVKPGHIGFAVTEAKCGQKLKWTFQTDGHFCYGVFFSAEPQCERIADMTPVYPRFNKVPGPTHVPLSDEIECEHDGTYKIWFSNEHAWIHSLQIDYRFDVN